MNCSPPTHAYLSVLSPHHHSHFCLPSLFYRITAMKTIPPKNPHFFKPIHQGFKNGVDIPTAFLAKYLKGQAPKFAILRRGDRSWRVKIRGDRMLGNGWEKFAAENGLNVGYFVVFRQERDTVFDVSVFEPSLCERDYCPLPHAACPLPQPSNNFRSYVPATTSSLSAENPHFVATIQPYCLRKPNLYLPLEFARSNGLVGEEKREMILRDDKERSWPVVLGRMGRHVALMRGWLAFQMANGLKEGDEYKFELIESGKKPIAKFHCHFSGEED
ncbi:PREDICTED: B3 domain-containing protein REM10-like [Ipomoea nil]|uniref:B3 domain-containing protein REM10-like n=1 Tax=Ipomoea nil TaxID=35883 RepID=UPI0009018EEC|nr:PREDICTED: B3 domain-containing protein REM10-like [Ipomoea nil]